ncbi:MAG: hypothetical protein K8R90_05600 [Candidatus Cloacimonetes bacterium]|nr:hypothetical protein [Candidatus Cloacimonadota bacterium]
MSAEREKNGQLVGYDTGFIVGYDPGGNNKHGIAIMEVESGRIVSVTPKTLFSAEKVINEIKSISNVIGLGVDTLTCWSTGKSGWRPADKWLREKYKVVEKSVSSPNFLMGAMSLNGMSVLLEVSRSFPNCIISETHPKVLYYALMTKEKDKVEKYNYQKNKKEMDKMLSKLLGLVITTKSDHEWDAAISAYAVWMGMTGSWKRDLHKLEVENTERIVKPCGDTSYFWPVPADKIVAKKHPEAGLSDK